MCTFKVRWGLLQILTGFVEIVTDSLTSNLANCNHDIGIFKVITAATALMILVSENCFTFVKVTRKEMDSDLLFNLQQKERQINTNCFNYERVIWYFFVSLSSYCLSFFWFSAILNCYLWIVICSCIDISRFIFRIQFTIENTIFKIISYFKGSNTFSCVHFLYVQIIPAQVYKEYDEAS
jgi:uncharacterized membrane protein YjjP (DUF1212 family)